MSNPIGWCDETINPITGCTKISPACLHCYAERMAQRLKGRYGYPADEPFRPGTFHSTELLKPFGWRKPRFVFVVSMGDLFHEAVKDEHLDWIFDIVGRKAPQHTYLLLTKRPDNMKQRLSRLYGENGPYPNVWLGVTAEDQQRADERIPILLSIPAAKHFVSVEPMLGPVDLLERGYLADHEWKKGTPGGLGWVIAGGETGPGARPMQDEWAMNLRDQCQEAGVAFWFKKHGGWWCKKMGYNPGSYADHTLGDRQWEQRPSN